MLFCLITVTDKYSVKIVELVVAKIVIRLAVDKHLQRAAIFALGNKAGRAELNAQRPEEVSQCYALGMLVDYVALHVVQVHKLAQLSVIERHKAFLGEVVLLSIQENSKIGMFVGLCGFNRNVSIHNAKYYYQCQRAANHDFDFPYDAHGNSYRRHYHYP